MPPEGHQAAAGSRLDRWVDTYAARTRGMTASEIRALFAVASRPEVVSLAGGMPFLSALPLDVVGEALSTLVAERGAVALQYGSGQGDPGLRERILDVMAPQQVDAHPDDIVVTTGSQQALDLVTRIFVDPGDVVVAEAPSYVGALGVFRAYQADVVHVPLDDDGLVPAALEDALTRLRREGRRVKLLYTVPNHHNPAGVTLSAARRPEIVEIARRHGVLVLEDDPYGLLGFDGDPLASMHSLDREGVVYLGSFSKTFAPGFRVGWAVAPHAVRERLVLASEAAILCPSAFSQLAVSHVPRHPRLEAPGRGLPRPVPGARDGHPGRPGRPPADRDVDDTEGRLLRVGHSSGGARRDGHAPPGGHRTRRLCAGDGVLCGRPRPSVPAPVVLLPDVGADP